jgi:predicted Na+-dependent transporter
MSGYQRVSRLILPVGIVVALALGLLLPAPGEWLASLGYGPADVTSVSVVLIFLISGVAIHGAAVQRSGLPRTAAVVLAANLLVAPLIAGAALHLLPLDGGLAFGLAVMASVPTTLSSAAVMTQVAGGDQVWGAALTVACVAVGAFTAPLAVSALLQTRAGVPALPLLVRVVALVIIPLAVGYVAARITGWTVNRYVALIPSLGVIALAWVTVSRSAQSLRDTPPARLAATVGLVAAAHAVMLVIGAVASRGLPRPQRLAAFFVAAQKTLPLALTLVAAVSALVPSLQAAAAEAVVVAVLWHFTQLLVDGALAARLARRNPARTARPRVGQ